MECMLCRLKSKHERKLMLLSAAGRRMGRSHTTGQEDDSFASQTILAEGTNGDLGMVATRIHRTVSLSKEDPTTHK